MMNDLSEPNGTEPESEAVETAAWHWLAYQSGLTLRRAKAVLDALPEGRRSLRAMLEADASLQQLALTPAETQLLHQNPPDWPRLVAQLKQWQTAGIHLIRRNQPHYPYTLRTHLPPAEQPLFLSYRGEAGLWEMPLIRAMVGDAPDDEALDWTLHTLQALAFEGALPLLVAQAGFSAILARHFLQEHTPFALVIPQGLAAYTPPPTLQAAIDGGRVLLISPFSPDKQTPDPTPLLPPTRRLARTLAHALLIITLPHPQGLLPEQPCFLRPGLAKTVGCHREFIDAEDLFLQLSEIPLAAAPYLSPDPAPPPAMTDPALLPTTPPIPSPDPEELIEQLSRLGDVPDILKQRLRRKSGTDAVNS